MHIARHELDFCVGITGTGLIEDAHPGTDVEFARVRVLALGESQVVVCPPGNAPRLIRHAGFMFAGFAGEDLPDQGGASIESARQ